MKTYGFNNKIPPNIIDPRARKSVAGNVSVNDNGNKISKNVNLDGKAPADPGNSEPIVSGKDRIELSINRAAFSGAETSRYRSDNNNPVGREKEIKYVIYSVESVSGAGKIHHDASRDIKLSNVRQKIADGYYNNPEFIERLAEVLIEKFYLSEERG